MAMIVGRDYAYIECNTSDCKEVTDKIYGENAQSLAAERARKSGWYKNIRGQWFCPLHRGR